MSEKKDQISFEFKFFREHDLKPELMELIWEQVGRRE